MEFHRKSKEKEVQICCGGVKLRNGRCPICGEKYEEEDIDTFDDYQYKEREEAVNW